MSIIGVYKAQFAFSANSPQELSVEEGDLLYLFERGDDGWWTCKKRVAGAANEEPTGLVPHNFVAPAQPQGSATALYNYDAQTTEEMSFNEGALFDVYAQDGDWVLAGAQGKFGFVPANYIKTGESAPPPLPKKDFAPPPKHASAVSSAAASSISLPQPKPPAASTELDTDVPPPMPKRPGTSQGASKGHSPRSPPSQSSQNRPKSFSVHNVDRRSTSDVVVDPDYLSIDGKKWKYKDILSYSTEKKHLFIELQNPRASLDLRTETRDTAEQILAAIAGMAGAHRGGGGLTEVFVAAKSAGHKTARVSIDFVAANGREVTVKEGELVFVLDQSDKQWWLVRNHAGAEGMLPSHIIELEEEKSKGIWPFKKSSSKKDKDQEISREPSFRKDDRRGSRDDRREHDRRGSRDDRRENDRRSSRDDRREHEPRSSHDDRNAKRGDPALRRSNSKRQPDQRKIRTWTDRSKNFRVEAALLGCADGKIHLHKQNGVKIAVPANKLSASDLEYVESVTGISFSEDKPLVDKIDGNKRSSREPSSSKSRSGKDHTSSRDDHHHSSRGASSHNSELSPSGFDWFDFFLGCGIDPQTCQRYAVNFSRDRMDEASIPSLTPQILRNLGLKEGDILRVTKKVREKFPSDEDAWVRRDPPAKSPTPDAANLRASQSPALQAAPVQAQAAPPRASPQPVLQPQQTSAAQRSLSQPVSSQPTGALADLLGFTSLEPSPQAQAQAQTQQQQQRALQPQVTSQQQDELAARQRALREAQEKLQDQKHEAERKMLEAQRTAQTNQERVILEQQANLQKQQIELLKRQQEELRKQQDDYIQVQRTGQSIRASLGPFATGVAQQSTGNFGNFGPSAAATLGQNNSVATPTTIQDPFAPINKFVPVQNQTTGGPFVQQTTGGPFGQQTTGGPFGQQTTGGPFGQQVTGGPFPQQTTGGPFAQPLNTGFQASQPFAPIQHKPLQQQAQPFQPQTTGPFGVQSQQTGPFGQQQQQPQFGAQSTGPFAPMQQQRTGPFGAQTTGFGQPSAQPFGSQSTNGGVFAMQQQRTGPFGAPSASSAPAQPFGAQQTGPFQQQHTGNQNYGAPAVNQPKNDPFGEIFRQYTGKQNQPTLSQASTGNVFQPQQPFQPQGFQPQQPFQAQGLQQNFQQQPFQPQVFPTGQPQPQVYPQQQQQFSGAPMQTQPFQQQQQYQAPAQQPQRTGGFQPQSQFGQQLQNQPLQSQPTGFGFGNQPQGANFNQASAANPFGF